MKIITGFDYNTDISQLSKGELDAITEQIRNAAKQQRTAIARQVIATSQCNAVDHPTSVFMAGAPGAGKTEVSKGLVSLFSRGEVLRLDPDDFRPYFDCYNGGNSHIVQRAITPIVERCIDFAMNKKINLLLDGTLSHWPVANRNITRALTEGRNVIVMFVLQDPHVSWEFVKARERLEGRRILLETFVDQYFGSLEVMKQVIATFWPRVITWCTVKNAMTGQSDNILLKTTGCLEKLIKQQYTRDALISALQCE